MTPPSTTAPKSAAGLIFGDLEHELASTRRMLERFPDGHADWKPHEKSTALAKLATHVADIPGYGALILGADELDLASRTPLAPIGNAADLLAHFDARVKSTMPMVQAADFESLERTWVMRAGDRVVVKLPKSAALRTVLINHMIHHRAQLGVYYRLLGVALPGTYGPSADEA